jgi:hypothetical protein
MSTPTPRGKFAAKTDVPAERTMAEIEATLQRYGCQQFARLTDRDAGTETIAWRTEGAGYRITIHGTEKDQVRRQRWRATLLAIKAVLEWSAINEVPVSALLMPHLVLADGRTVAESTPVAVAQIAGRGWSALLEGSGRE